MTEPEREVYHDTPPTAEELKGNAYGYCYGSAFVIEQGWRPFPLVEQDHDHQ